MTSTDCVLDVRDFRMDFGATTVIRDLSFDVRRGETFGLLGSNGCGKTTTIRALLGIYTPTAGTLLVEGKRYEPGSGVRLGYLPEERGLYKKEPVLDVMTYFGRLKGMSRTSAQTWSQRYLETVGLGKHAKLRLDKLSGGQQQKVQLGVTIMNDPDILILDEPTKGFDPVNRRLLMDLIEERRRAGASIVIITHQMEEVERLCDRILLLKDGKAEAYGTVADVQDQYGGQAIRLGFSGVLPTSAHFKVVSAETNYAELELTDGGDPTAVLRELLDAGLEIRSFDATRISLDEVFLRVYGAEASTEGDATPRQAVA